MTLPLRIAEVAELDFAYEPTPWRFAEAEAAAIASHWARLRKKKPALYNGRILLLHRRELVRRADGELKLQGSFFETGYADFVAWRAFGHPGEPVENCFAMAALRGADGAFLLGEMAPHTFSAGQIYFRAGTPTRATSSTAPSISTPARGASCSRKRPSRPRRRQSGAAGPSSFRRAASPA